MIKLFVNSTIKLDLDNYDKGLWIIDYSKILDTDTLPGEKWKNFGEIYNVNYTDMYNSSNLGRIKSLSRYVIKNGNYVLIKERILKQSKGSNGYYYVNLSKNGKENHATVHKLVASAFCENNDPINKTCINHIDEIRTNNCASNLEWCTLEYNVTYGTIKEKQSMVKKIKVVQLDKNGNFVKEWDSALDVKNELGIKNVTQCCKKKRKTSGGYIWMYLLDYEKNINNIKEYIINSKKRNGKPVVQLSLSGDYINTWNSITELKEAGFHHQKIINCCKNRRDSYKGYRWIYLSEY